MKTQDHFAYRNLKEWPEEERWELIDGEAVQMFSPNVEHQRAVGRLLTQLVNWLKGKSCEPFVAPLDVLFRSRPDQDEDDVDTVLQPDLMIVCDLSKVKRNGVHGAPDWVLEILSPSTTWRDLTIKRGVYQKHGVKEYWVLNPDTLISPSSASRAKRLEPLPVPASRTRCPSASFRGSPSSGKARRPRGTPTPP